LSNGRTIGADNQPKNRCKLQFNSTEVAEDEALKDIIADGTITT
jgi:hypothetical protein